MSLAIIVENRRQFWFWHFNRNRHYASVSFVHVKWISLSHRMIPYAFWSAVQSESKCQMNENCTPKSDDFRGREQKHIDKVNCSGSLLRQKESRRARECVSVDFECGTRHNKRVRKPQHSQQYHFIIVSSITAKRSVVCFRCETVKLAVLFILFCVVCCFVLILSLSLCYSVFCACVCLCVRVFVVCVCIIGENGRSLWITLLCEHNRNTAIKRKRNKNK